MSNKKRRIIMTLLLLVILIASGVAVYYVGKPLIAFVSDSEGFRSWVEANTWWSRIVFIGMQIIQVVLSVIPGGAFEIAAGYAFGAVEGTILCTVGTTLGSVLVFLLVRRFGVKLVLLFFSEEKLRSAKFMQNENRLSLILFIVFLIPGAPKDLLCYAAGLTNIKLSRWIAITSIARIPAITISTVGGNAIGTESYSFAVGVFIFTIIASLIGILIYRRITKTESDDVSEN